MNYKYTYNLQSAEAHLSKLNPAQLILFCMGSKPASDNLQPMGASKNMKFSEYGNQTGVKLPTALI